MKSVRDIPCSSGSSKEVKDPANMIFTEEDKRNYDKATKCHICGKDGFIEGDEKKQSQRPLPPNKHI